MGTFRCNMLTTCIPSINTISSSYFLNGVLDAQSRNPGEC